MAADYSYFRGRQSTIDALTNNKGGSKIDPNEYRVKYSDGDGGVYQSVIRFIPIPDGIVSTKTDYLFKYVTWLTNPKTNEKKCIDNPTTVGDTKNPLDNLMWALLTSKNETAKNIAKTYMRRTEQYVALVQIINDPKHPEYNNRIMYMRFGNSINDKLVQELSPNQALGITYPSPFDMINGRLFNLIVTSKNGQNDYSQSRFIDSASLQNIPSGMRYVNAQGQVVAITDETNEQEYPYVNQYLLSQVAKIDLAKHEYKPWDDFTTQFVNESLEAIAEYAQTGVLPQNDVLHQAAQTVSPTSFIPQTPTAPQVHTIGAQPQAQTTFAPPTAPQVPQSPQIPTTPVTAPLGESVGVADLPIPPTAGVVQQPVTTAAPKTQGSRFGDLSDVIY